MSDYQCKYNVAIAGATGAVGGAMLDVLKRRNFPINTLRLLASKRSVGKKITFMGKDLEVELLNKEAFEGIDIALFLQVPPDPLTLLLLLLPLEQLLLTIQAPIEWILKSRL